MPTATAKKAPVKKAAAPGRPRKRAAEPVQQEQQEQPALIERDEPERPDRHNGIKVVREELLQNLPRAPFRITRLWLDDGNVAFACRDCLFTGDSRGIVMAHRNETHGASFGLKRRIADIPPFRGTPDPIIAYGEGRTPSPDPLDWTLKELLAVCPSITALGDLVEEAQRQRDTAVEDLADLKISTRDMRIKAEQYDKVRDELNALRNWKRKMITRLEQMGFSPKEEDE